MDDKVYGNEKQHCDCDRDSQSVLCKESRSCAHARVLVSLRVLGVHEADLKCHNSVRLYLPLCDLETVSPHVHYMGVSYRQYRKAL